MWGSIIGGTIGAIGAFAGAKEQSKAGKLDLAHLRREALANGFNPLTVLESTGGAGSQTTAAPGFLSFLAQQAPALGQTYDARMTEAPLNQANIENINSRTALNHQMAKESQWQMGRPNSAAARDYMAEYLKNPDGYTTFRTPNGETVELRNDYAHALGLEPGSLYGLAEHAEAAFGEIGGEVTGVGNVADATFGSNPMIRGGPRGGTDGWAKPDPDNSMQNRPRPKTGPMAPPKKAPPLPKPQDDRPWWKVW